MEYFCIVAHICASMSVLWHIFVYLCYSHAHAGTFKCYIQRACGNHMPVGTRNDRRDQKDKEKELKACGNNSNLHDSGFGEAQSKPGNGSDPLGPPLYTHINNLYLFVSVNCTKINK